MSTNIKAYQVTSITGIGGIQLAEIRKPVPGPGQVLIRIHAVSLNFRDLMIINGQYGDTPPPFVPVADGAGEIIGLGEGVTRLENRGSRDQHLFSKLAHRPDVHQSAQAGSRRGTFGHSRCPG